MYDPIEVIWAELRRLVKERKITNADVAAIRDALRALERLS